MENRAYRVPPEQQAQVFPHVVGDPTPRIQTLESLIQARLGDRDISPEEVKHFGLEANLDTCDEVTELFERRLRSHNPNGYIVGVGAGGIFTHLDGFTAEHQPKGLVMVDINPQVVATGRILINRLTESDNPNELEYSLFGMDQAEYEAQLASEGRKDPTLDRGLRKWQIKAAPPHAKNRSMRSLPESRTIPYVPALLTQHFKTLKKLAIEGRIASVYTNFRNPDFIEAVKSLPDFQTSRNIIYTTNIIDITKGPQGIRDFEDLAKYDNENFPPIFVTSPMSLGNSMQIARSFEELTDFYR